VGQRSTLVHRGPGRMICGRMLRLIKYVHNMGARCSHSTAKKLSLNCHHQRSKGYNNHHTCKYREGMGRWRLLWRPRDHEDVPQDRHCFEHTLTLSMMASKRQRSSGPHRSQSLGKYGCLSKAVRPRMAKADLRTSRP